MSKKDRTLDNWKEYLRESKGSLEEKFSPDDFKDVYNTARMAHVGQTRRDGSEYFSHPSEVRNIARKFYPKDNVVQMAALLHDSLEDAPGSTVSSVEEMEDFIKGSIQDASSADEVIRVVRALTHEKGGDYLSYVVDLMGDIPTLRVKLSDMVHNLTDNPSPKQKAKYKSALEAISAKTGGSPPNGISSKHWETLMSLISDNVSEEVWDKEDGEYQGSIVKPKKVMGEWQGYYRNKPLFEDLDYITNVLGIAVPLSESGEPTYSEELQQSILQEHLLFESFFDSMKKWVKDKSGEVPNLFKSVYKIIKDPDLVPKFIDLIDKKVVEPVFNLLLKGLRAIKDIATEIIEKAIAAIEKVREFIEKLTGWNLALMLMFFAVSITVLQNKVSQIGSDNLLALIKKFIGEDLVKSLASKMTDFKTWLGAAGAVIGGVAYFANVLAPATKAFVGMVSEGILKEAAQSKAQQGYFGVIKRCKEEGDCPDEEIKKKADSMTAKQIDDFAGTKHQGLPARKDEALRSRVRDVVRRRLAEQQ